MLEIKNSRLLIDTDILIDHLRGRINLVDLIGDSSNNASSISVISIAEIYSLLYLHEYEIVENLFSFLNILNVDQSIAKLAGNYRMNFIKSFFLTVPDAIVEATR